MNFAVGAATNGYACNCIRHSVNYLNEEEEAHKPTQQLRRLHGETCAQLPSRVVLRPSEMQYINVRSPTCCVGYESAVLERYCSRITAGCAVLLESKTTHCPPCAYKHKQVARNGLFKHMPQHHTVF